jgi:putative tricarboxylic transport membrane protein
LKTGDIVSGAALAGLGVFIITEARRWEYLGPDGPGPGFFPLWIGMALVGLSALLVARQYAEARSGKPSAATGWKGARPVLVGWVALMVAAALVKPAGFTVTYALLTAFLIRVVFRRTWTAALAVSLVSAAAFWLLFVKLLRVQLPAGPWGF